MKYGGISDIRLACMRLSHAIVHMQHDWEKSGYFRDLGKVDPMLQELVQAAETNKNSPERLRVELMLAAGRHFEASTVSLFHYLEETRQLVMRASTLAGAWVDVHSDPRMAVWREPFEVGPPGAWEYLTSQDRCILGEISASNPLVWPFSLPWHLSMGHRFGMCFALKRGEKGIGVLGFAFTRDVTEADLNWEYCAQLARYMVLADIQLEVAAKTDLSLLASRSLLTGRELEILQRVDAGFSNKEIASQLGMSESTVKVHLRNVFGKLGVHSRTGALNRLRSFTPGTQQNDPKVV
jgi:DNA-binding CsgD family transcriptional regulator